MADVIYNEIVWKREREQDYGSETLQARLSVFADKDKVSLCHSSFVDTPHRNKDGSFRYWRTTATHGFRRNAAGNIQPYQATRELSTKGRGANWRARGNANAPFTFLESDTDEGAAGAFKWACEYYLGITSVLDLYPGAADFGIERYPGLPVNLRTAYRHRDPAEIIRAALGKVRATPTMVHAAAGADPYVLSMAAGLRGFIPDSTLVSFMNEQVVDEDIAEVAFINPSKMRQRYFQHMQPQNLEFMLSRGLDGGDYRAVVSLTQTNPKKQGVIHPGHMVRIQEAKDFRELPYL